MKGCIRAIGLAGMVLLLTSCAAVAGRPVDDVLVTAAPGAEEQQLPATAVPRAVTTTDDVQRIGVDEAHALVEAGEAVLYDVRSPQAYSSSHAAGAVSLPESQAPGRAGELPRDQALIFY
jgi:hypothetical protein